MINVVPFLSPGVMNMFEYFSFSYVIHLNSDSLRTHENPSLYSPSPPCFQTQPFTTPFLFFANSLFSSRFCSVLFCSVLFCSVLFCSYLFSSSFHVIFLFSFPSFSSISLKKSHSEAHRVSSNSKISVRQTSSSEHERSPLIQNHHPQWHF